MKETKYEREWKGKANSNAQHITFNPDVHKVYVLFGSLLIAIECIVVDWYGEMCYKSHLT